MEFDEADLRLMKLLQRGRASYAEMAAEVGLSVSACRTRVLRLIDTNVMQIGAIRRRAATSQAMAFGFGTSTSGHVDQAVDYLQQVVGTEFMAKCMGRYNLIATVGVASVGEYNRVATGLRQLGSVTTVKSLDTLVDRIAKGDG